MADANNPQAEMFRKYLADKKILVADTSNVSREYLAKALLNMGASTLNVVLAQSFAVAETEIERVKPQIIVSDYDLGKRCGIELLQKQRLHSPDVKNNLFVLVTANTSQTAVARAAEEDVDTFILKPYTTSSLQNAIFRAAAAKLSPSLYLKAVELGKSQMDQYNLEEATKTLLHAKTLDAAPTLACFYLGEIEVLKKNFDAAEAFYNEGLLFNKIHYKCLLGIYNVMMQKQKYHEAYSIIKKISSYFPANPLRLTLVLKLAVITQSYDDVEKYYQVFAKLDERNQEMVRYVCAALVVCGKHYLQKNIRSRAIDLFKKAVDTTDRKSKILREVIVSLMALNLVKQSEEFLKLYPADTQKSPEYLAMHLYVHDRDQPKALSIEKAKELIGNSVFDPFVYQVLIQRSVESGALPEAESAVQQASTRWPDLKDKFLITLKETQDRIKRESA